MERPVLAGVTGNQAALVLDACETAVKLAPEMAAFATAAAWRGR